MDMEKVPKAVAPKMISITMGNSKLLKKKEHLKDSRTEKSIRPVVIAMKGKIRNPALGPKKKKLSTLKKSILRERRFHKLLLEREKKEGNDSIATPDSPSTAINTVSESHIANPQTSMVIESLFKCNIENQSENDNENDKKVTEEDEDDEEEDEEEEEELSLSSLNISETRKSSKAAASTSASGSSSREKEEYDDAERAEKQMKNRSRGSYVTHACNSELEKQVEDLLTTLISLQQKSTQKKETNKAKKRLILGIREVIRGAKARSIKCVIIATDLEQAGAIDDRITDIIDACNQTKLPSGLEVPPTPLIFCLSRRKLGRLLGKSIKVSIVGVSNIDGVAHKLKSITNLLHDIKNGLISSEPTSSQNTPKGTEQAQNKQQKEDRKKKKKKKVPLPLVSPPPKASATSSTIANQPPKDSKSQQKKEKQKEDTQKKQASSTSISMTSKPAQKTVITNPQPPKQQQQQNPKHKTKTELKKPPPTKAITQIVPEPKVSNIGSLSPFAKEFVPKVAKPL